MLKAFATPDIHVSGMKTIYATGSYFVDNSNVVDAAIHGRRVSAFSSSRHYQDESQRSRLCLGQVFVLLIKSR